MSEPERGLGGRRAEGSAEGRAAEIRSYRPEDGDALYEICLLSGDSGRDASAIYRLPRLLGDVFVGPYLALQPELAFVLDDGTGAVGYVLGAVDTAQFALDCERLWWPEMRARYAAEPRGGADEWLLRWIEAPPGPPSVVSAFPAHLHIDLLPAWQSGGWGRRMIDTLLDPFRKAGSPGVHLGVGRGNGKARGFYRHIGFEDLAEDENTCWMGKRLS